MSSRVRRLLLVTAVAVPLLTFVVVGLLTGVWWGLTSWGLYAPVGAVILRREPGHGIGRILVAIGFAWAVAQLAALVDRAPVMVEVLATAAAYQAWLLFTLLLVLYPSGRPQSSLGRATTGAIVAVAALVLVLSVVDPAAAHTGRANPLGISALQPVLAWFLDGAGFLVVPLLATGALVDLVRRWHASAGDERLQLRWLAWSTGLVVLALVVSVPVENEILFRIGSWVLALIPISIGIAITRHGLYSIDRVVSRTVSYALVTALVLAVYAAVVTSVTRILPVSSTLAVAGATLAAAAAFRPALRRVQGWVDRRFDRRSYDIQRTVDAFGRSLRSSVDADEAVAGRLLAAVGAALAPARLGLWLPPRPERRRT